MAHRFVKRFKLMYRLRIIRNNEPIYDVKRKRDLLVWRGQMVLAYLLSQGVVGTSTNTWKVIASSNSTSPDMADDSGNPETNEFNPTLGTPASVTYEFEPTTKPSGGYQTYGEFRIKGIITVTSNGTLRKIGIIDQIATPNRHIIVEDAVVPKDVLIGDGLEISYFLQMG